MSCLKSRIKVEFLINILIIGQHYGVVVSIVLGFLWVLQLIGESKLPIDVNVRMNGCLSQKPLLG